MVSKKAGSGEGEGKRIKMKFPIITETTKQMVHVLLTYEVRVI